MTKRHHSSAPSARRQQGKARALLAMALMFLAAPCWSATTRLAFTHYALRQADLRFDLLDGTDVTGTMGYGGFKPWLQVQPGQHRLDVRSADGTLLGSEDVLLEAGSSHSAYFAGDGLSRKTAHEIRISRDPIQPILSGSAVNVVNLALPTDARFGSNVTPFLFAGFDCHRHIPVGEADADIAPRYPQTIYASGTRADPGSRELVADLNAQALSWLTRTANVRVHRTTAERPRVRFERDERVVLRPLAARPYRWLVMAASTPKRSRQLQRPALLSVERRSLAWYDRLTGVAR